MASPANKRSVEEKQEICNEGAGSPKDRNGGAGKKKIAIEVRLLLALP